MTPAVLSEALFAVGRRRPRFPVAFLRATPLRLLHALRRPGLRATLGWAQRSAYYRDAFRQAGIDPRRVRDVEDLAAFSLPAETLKANPERLLCGTPELAIESSGTSGRGVTRIYLSRRELAYNARQGALLLGLYDVRPDDRLLCTLDLAWGLGSLLAERGLRGRPGFTMVVGRVDPREAYERLATYGFSVVVSDPFWLGRLTELARERGRPRPLRLMIGGGEGVTRAARTGLERFWEAPLRMTYASTEAATILGFECPHGTGLHVNEFDFGIEIDRPDAEGYGEIVLTTLTRRVMPLVRYRTGDVARWLQGRCPCRLPFRRLSPLRGRLDEQVPCVWGNVHPEFFERLLADVPGIGGDWQVALGERDLKPVFQWRLEADPGQALAAGVPAAVLSALERLHPEASQAWRQRLVDQEFAFFAPGTLRRRRKLVRLVDERDSGPPPWAAEALKTVAAG
jgi:phenylacetate-CoA ligase